MLPGMNEWEGVLHRPSVYTQEQTGSGSSGIVSQENQPNAPFSGVGTQLVLLDIPLIHGNDAPYGFYAAGGPVAAGRWSGYTLYKSLDGGVNWEAIAAENSPSIIGVTSTAAGSPVGSPSIYGVLSSYSGGETIDESSICVTLTDNDAELSSTNALGLTNGSNLCAISRGYAAGSPSVLQWEILQYRDAELIADQMYVISGFKRGRKGTLTSGHADGDLFVVLPTTNVNAPASEMDVPLLYKAVTFGHTIASASPYSFTNTGVGLESYYSGIGGGIPPFVGDIGSPSAPAQGAVPAPAVGDAAAFKFLKADGTWQVVAPPSASYLVRSANSILTNESVLQPGSRVTFTDGGGSPPTSLTVSALLQFIVLTPTFSTTLSVDLAAYTDYPVVLVDVTLTDNFTFNISNGFNGQIIRVRFKQDGTGSRIFTAGGNLRFSTSTPSPVLTTTANKIDRLAFEWHTADGKADLIAINKAF